MVSCCCCLSHMASIHDMVCSCFRLNVDTYETYLINELSRQTNSAQYHIVCIVFWQTHVFNPVVINTAIMYIMLSFD